MHRKLLLPFSGANTNKIKLADCTIKCFQHAGWRQIALFKVIWPVSWCSPMGSVAVLNFKNITTSKLFLALALVYACSNYTACGSQPAVKNNLAVAEVQPVIITVKDTSIWRRTGTVPDFYYHDSLGHGHQVLLSKTENKLIIPSPVFLLQANELQTPFYVYPGEHIIVSQDGATNILLSVAGNDRRSNELLLARNLVKNTGVLSDPLTQKGILKTVSNLQEFTKLEQDILTKKRDRVVFIDTFSQRHYISPKFKAMMQSAVDNAAIDDELLLLWKNKTLQQGGGSVFKTNIASCITRLNNQDTTLYNYMYYYALSNAVSISNTKFIGDLIFDSADFVKKFAFIKSNFTKGARSFLLANIINQAINNDIPVAKNAVQDFYTVCTINTYGSLIAEKIRQQGQFSYPKGASKLLLADGKTVKDIQDVFASYKGKLILLDFWASWCSPCRAEMPWSRKLRDAYTGKDIAFVYIATGDEVHDWKNASAEEALGTKDNWFLLNAQTSTFVAQNNIQAIPRFMLLGKDGKIINKDAPRPSAAKLKELIDKYLK